MKFFITHHTGQILALRVNEETTRKILRNVGPADCHVTLAEEPHDGLNGAEWFLDNPNPQPA